MQELKPCPFCAGEAKIRYFKAKYSYYIECKNCDSASGYSSNEQSAIERWNKRVEV